MNLVGIDGIQHSVGDETWGNLFVGTGRYACNRVTFGNVPCTVLSLTLLEAI